MKAPLIYIAGPFRAGTAWAVEHNVREAERLGLQVALVGGIPIIPHTMYRFFNGTLTERFWIEATLQILETCHVMVVTEHWEASSGTIGEILKVTEQLHIPIFYAGELCPKEGNSIVDLPSWIDNWKETHK